MAKYLRFILFFMSSSVFAGVNSDIAKCSAIEGSGERLSCFDDLSKKLGLNKPKTKTTVGKGKWRVTESVSKIDDSTTVYVTVDSNETVRGKFGSEHPSLWLRCAENKTEAFINVGLYLGLNETSVLTRMDKDKAVTKTWSISTDTKAIFVRGSDIRFAKELMQHEKLLVQLTPYNDNPVTFEFDVGGLSEAIKPLRKACHW
jgi:type VI secretion system protein VasI